MHVLLFSSKILKNDYSLVMKDMILVAESHLNHFEEIRGILKDLNKRNDEILLTVIIEKRIIVPDNHKSKDFKKYIGKNIAIINADDRFGVSTSFFIIASTGLCFGARTQVRSCLHTALRHGATAVISSCGNEGIRLCV